MIWQGAWLVFVSTVVEAAVMAGAVLAPAVIHHDCILQWSSVVKRGLSQTLNTSAVTPVLKK